MIYGLIRFLVALAVRVFYRVELQGPATEPTGPVIFVGNHPNGLIDPTLVFVATRRKVTFMAKAPLFKMPVIGWLLRGLEALPVFRRQDDPTQMNRNEGSFEAATEALRRGGAIMLFPEGKSHSEPGLAELKTGAARIALRALRQGVALQLVPVGLTYAEKHRFRSRVLVERGETLIVEPDLVAKDETEAVRELTDRMARALRRVTLNLEAWEDLPLVETAEQLYALRSGAPTTPERQRRWAAGMDLVRSEEPVRFSRIRTDLMSFHRRLSLVRADPADLSLVYRRGPVYRFVAKNLLSLLVGFPFFALGICLFFVPYYIPGFIVRAVKPEEDVEATVKFLAMALVAPLWWALLVTLAAFFIGPVATAVALVGVPPLALFTRYFLEHWKVVLHDVSTFFVLGSRSRLKGLLLVEGERLSTEVGALANQYGERVMAATSASR